MYDYVRTHANGRRVPAAGGSRRRRTGRGAVSRRVQPQPPRPKQGPNQIPVDFSGSARDRHVDLRRFQVGAVSPEEVKEWHRQGGIWRPSSIADRGGTSGRPRRRTKSEGITHVVATRLAPVRGGMFLKVVYPTTRTSCTAWSELQHRAAETRRTREQSDERLGLVAAASASLPKSCVRTNISFCSSRQSDAVAAPIGVLPGRRVAGRSSAPRSARPRRRAPVRLRWCGCGVAQPGYSTSSRTSSSFSPW